MDTTIDPEIVTAMDAELAALHADPDFETKIDRSVADAMDAELAALHADLEMDAELAALE